MFKKWFKKRDDTTVWITPYVSMYSSSGEIAPEVKQTVSRISNKLNVYLDAMCKRNRAAFSNIAILANISANYNVAEGTVELLATGGGLFNWHGSLENFLESNNLNELKIEELK